MGNANPNHAVYGQIASTDDAEALKLLLPNLINLAAFPTNALQNELTSLTGTLYYNACVKCLVVMEHCLDSHAMPNASEWWAHRYHSILAERYTERVTPELLTLIRQAENHESLSYRNKAKTAVSRPETRLGLAVYYDDVKAVKAILRRYPKLYKLHDILSVARQPNHQGQITAPRLIAAYPELTKPEFKLDDIVHAFRTTGMQVKDVDTEDGVWKVKVCDK